MISSPLETWHFLVGEWRGYSKDQFGGEGLIEISSLFTLEMNAIYLMSVHEARREGALENQSVALMFYDTRNRRFLRKTFFSYGFVNNEVEYMSSDSEIRFEITSEPNPEAFASMRWRSYIRKVSDHEVRMGLESANEGEDFVSYGETIMERVK
nr:MAG: hypothetical protein AM324_06800 [Candidatus Thorarchaeota archaeon SMTZ1-83]